MTQLSSTEIFFADREALVRLSANAQLGGIVVLVVEVRGVAAQMRHQ